MSAETALPRLLTLMGSGETSPTMVRVHRSILERLGPRPVPAILLDTPFGFQENADELSLRVSNYFRESLQTTITNASGVDPENRTEDDGQFITERLTINIQRARYVFSGPGSPTYALRKWKDTVIPQLLAEKLRNGGAITFASAAALTLGALTVPVYEIYKVGEDPCWLPGLDLLSEVGLNVAVIPHYNNAEGGTHDTHFCYLGERRLRLLEEQMPDSSFVLGIDEHTSCSFDLDARTATVGGIGQLTIRKNGRSTTFDNGAVISIEEIVEAALSVKPSVRAPSFETSNATGGESKRELLVEFVQRAEKSFLDATADRDATGVTATVLGLEQEIHDWSSDAPGQDEMDRARAALRSMIGEFAKLVGSGLEDPTARLAPFVELLISLRTKARSERRFEDADTIRDRLGDLGIELRDSSETTSWSLRARS